MPDIAASRTKMMRMAGEYADGAFFIWNHTIPWLKDVALPALAQGAQRSGRSLDDLERAFTVIPPSLAQLTWVEGIALIHRKLMAILEAQGVREIDAQDQPFDPQLHEAIAQSEGPEGMVVQVIQRGYSLHDRVLRPALVQVGNGSTASSDDEADGGQPTETKTDQN